MKAIAFCKPEEVKAVVAIIHNALDDCEIIEAGELGRDLRETLRQPRNESLLTVYVIAVPNHKRTIQLEDMRMYTAEVHFAFCKLDTALCIGDVGYKIIKNRGYGKPIDPVFYDYSEPGLFYQLGKSFGRYLQQLEYRRNEEDSVRCDTTPSTTAERNSCADTQSD